MNERPYLAPGPDTGPENDNLAERVGERVGLAALDTLERRARHARAPGRAVGRAWTLDLRDRLDRRWWPQGIDLGAHRGRRFVAVSWYAKKRRHEREAQGARVTFLDLETLRYRHVLLVTPTLEPLQVHAGGIVWAGDFLYVAATGAGMHVCRLSDVLAVSTHHRKTVFGYHHVLPTWRRYRSEADAADGLRFSFMSLDRPTRRLLVGEYTGGGGTRRIAQFPLGDDDLPLLDAAGRCDAVSLGEGVDSMQGAAYAGDVLHVTTSHGRLHRGSVWTGTPGALRQHRFATPNGPEDLTFDPLTGDLWSVTEHPPSRWIVRLTPPEV